MSIYKTYSKNGPVPPDDDFYVEEEKQPCFYCGEVLGNDPIIEWLGQTAQIFLHARCAVEFALRMFRDVHKWESMTGRLVTAGPDPKPRR